MRLDDDLDQAEKNWESYHTVSTQFNVNFLFGNIMFYFIAI